MTEIKIDISELKKEASELKKELVEFLKEKTAAKVESGASEISVSGDGEAVSKSYLRVLLRKFLHRKELKENFRIIAQKENTFKIKERKTAEEEE
jgi:hypothetical protein